MKTKILILISFLTLFFCSSCVTYDEMFYEPTRPIVVVTNRPYYSKYKYQPQKYNYKHQKPPRRNINARPIRRR